MDDRLEKIRQLYSRAGSQWSAARVQAAPARAAFSLAVGLQSAGSLREFRSDRIRAMYRHVLLAVALTGLTFAQQATTPATVATITSAVAEVSSADEEVLAFERSLEAAFVRGDVAYYDRVSVPDLTVIHGDGWINGGKPSSVDDKKSFLKRVASKLYSVRDLDSVTVEMHGDIAITHGRLIAQVRTGSPDRSWLSAWYERVYEKRDGHWLLVSHRTLHGPTNGPNRLSVSER